MLFEMVLAVDQTSITIWTVCDRWSSHARARGAFHSSILCVSYRKKKMIGEEHSLKRQAELLNMDASPFVVTTRLKTKCGMVTGTFDVKSLMNVRYYIWSLGIATRSRWDLWRQKRVTCGWWHSKASQVKQSDLTILHRKIWPGRITINVRVIINTDSNSERSLER